MGSNGVVMGQQIRNTFFQVLFRRHETNPILTAEDWPYAAHTVFNPGAVRLKNGETLLLCRVEDFNGHSHLCAARSRNGVDGWNIDPSPTFAGQPEQFREELWGVEDPRITYIEELDQYAVVYTSFGWGGPGVSLALTKDFCEFTRYGLAMSPEDKDASLLPRRINGDWHMIHRPVGPMGAHIWVSCSPDLHHWGNHRIMLEARRGGWWDANKIGLSTPLIETERGWLMIYHGVRVTPSGSLYRLGLALFDLENPDRCIRRGDRWVFGPLEPYERAGDVGNVVFPCGCTIGEDGDSLNLYYGAADTSICLAQASIKELLEWLERCGVSEDRPLHLRD